MASGLTKFGLAWRRHRRRRKRLTYAHAADLGCTAALVSQFERAQCPLPADLVSKISACLGLTAAEERELSNLAYTSQNVIELKHSAASSIAGAHPLFELTSLASPRSVLPPHRLEQPNIGHANEFIRFIPWQEVLAAAAEFRATTGHGHALTLPMLEILEFELPGIVPGFELHIDPTEQLGEVEAYVANFPPRIVVSAETYNRAAAGDGRKKFTLAHEVGHLLFHLDYLSDDASARHPRSTSRELTFVPRSEKHANWFAVELLLPEWIAKQFPEPKQLARVSGVSEAAAERRLSRLGLWRPTGDRTGEHLHQLSQELRRLEKVKSDKLEPEFKTRIEAWGHLRYDRKKDEFGAVVRAGVKPIPSAPIGASWVITGACDKLCIGCYGNAEALPTGILSLSDCLQVVDILAQAGVMRVVISGGEPLLVPHLPDVVDALVAEDISVVVGTNGRLLTPQNIDRFRKCTRVEISLDGPDAETNNRIRPNKDSGSAFAETIRAIKLCVQAGIRLRVLTTLNKFNQDRIVEIAALLEKLGVRDWAISWTIQAGRAAPIYEQLRPQKEITDSQYRVAKVYFPSISIRYSNRDARFDRYYFMLLPDGQIATQELKKRQKTTFGAVVDVPITSVWNSQNFDLSAHFEKWVADRIAYTYD